MVGGVSFYIRRRLSADAIRGRGGRTFRGCGRGGGLRRHRQLRVAKADNTEHENEAENISQ